MICPFMEEADARCANHFSLINLNDAFTHCVGRHQACPVYQRLLRERATAMKSIAEPLMAPARIAV